ncbi:MAG TPA: IPExxxVDY family protein [Chitinophagales bacterium]|jgi:hypothetical protein|nr:IPExxxVDY family protein [Chitinophagales bacterium]
MAKRKLKIDPDFNFLLIGVATPLQDYRLAWNINKTLHKGLMRVEDVVVVDAESQRQTSFSRYDYFEELTKSHFHLLRNRQGTFLLLNEVKEMDYLLVVKGEYYMGRSVGMLKKLRQIESVQAVVSIPLASIRSKHNLILDTPATDI